MARASLPKLRDGFPTSSPACPKELDAIQADRWQRETGVSVEDSSFTLLVPIHQEERFLPSFLSSLMLSDLPKGLPLDIIFFTNDCTDRSVQIIQEFLGRLGSVERGRLCLCLSDAHVSPDVTYACSGNIRFSHIDSPTRGKANVLTVGNELAVAKGDQIVINLDANNFVEPDAIRAVFAKANRVFGDPDNSTVLLYGKVNPDRKPSLWTKAIEIGRKATTEDKEDPYFVAGNLMAWDSQWLMSIGGAPQVASEDYAMGFFARKGGNVVSHVPDSHVWAYQPNTLLGQTSIRARMIRGKMQIMELDEDTREEFADRFYMQPLAGRVKRFARRVKAQPVRTPLHLANFILWELAIHQARSDFTLDPHDISWKPVVSTK